jgi:hypothetical protein
MSALAPLAVLSLPVVLPQSARSPLAVLPLPKLSLAVVLLQSAWSPMAVLPLPSMLLKSAPRPLAVL